VSEAPAPEGRPAPRASVDAVLDPLPYHRQIVDYLQANETELWKWFSSTSFRDEYAATTRLELLKSCYRFDPVDHAEPYRLVEEAKLRLGLHAPITLYQSQSGAGMNASLCYIPGEAHLVLEGPIRTTLSLEEFRAIVAHELAHYLLWERHDGELLVADQLLSAMARHERTEPSHVESTRLFRLYLEVHCDRAALAVCPDPLVAISALIKVQTGLADAQAESYLRQSEEIFGQAEMRTEELTHPELFIRARALKLWADGGSGAGAEIARMIEGPLDLGRLSLLRQARLTDITRRVLMEFLTPAWLHTEPLLAHARLFFTDLDPKQKPTSLESPSVKDALAGADDSVKRYLSYVLLDLATVDRNLDEAPLAAALRLAEEIGLGEPFLAVASEELEMGKRSLARLRKDAAKVVSDAAAAPSES
jgi:hypothetical protein